MEDKEIAAKVRDLSEAELKLYRMRHSLAHVMATAVQRLYPGTKLAFGPPVDNGFYYDFDLPRPITAEELPAIEDEMRRILAQDVMFVREDLELPEAIRRISEMDQPYKSELAAELKEKGITSISFYRSGDFLDVCEGPHVERTRAIPPDGFKLDSIAGAYWRGTEKNKMLTRIYGLAFPTRKELQAFIKLREEALRRDHRKLGAELDIFVVEEEVGKGLPLWMPNGTVLREEIEKLAKEMEFKYGYKRVSTPEISRQELYFRSGHLPYYKDSMFPPMTVEEEGPGGTKIKDVFYLKPMNCPHHHMIYRARPRSYRELPLRLAEFGHDYRFERSGELAGLLRVRSMTMNDAHIYCGEQDVREEFKAVMRLHLDYYRIFDFHNYYMRVSLHDPQRKDKFMDAPALWERAERICIEAMDELGIPYKIAPGEAAFYGPKVDVQVRNVIGREETACTNQVDFLAAQPERFDMTFVTRDGSFERPIVLHRAPLGTHERFVAFLLEHYGGAFPTWLAPVQVRLLPITDKELEFAHTVRQALFDKFVRAEVDESSETLNKKIRNGTVQKVPILGIVGAREREESRVTVRRYRRRQQDSMHVDSFVAMVLEEIQARAWVKPDPEEL